MTTQSQMNIEPIRQYPGAVTVQRRVKVMVPGKFFNNLTPTEAAPASTEPGAERVQRLSPWLVFAYAADGLLELITSKQYVAARLEPCG